MFQFFRNLKSRYNVFEYKLNNKLTWMSNPRFYIPFSGVVTWRCIPIPTEAGPPLAFIIGMAFAFSLHLLKVYGLYPFSMPWYPPVQNFPTGGKVKFSKGKSKGNNSKGMTEAGLFVRWAQEEGHLDPNLDVANLLLQHFEFASKKESEKATIAKIMKLRTRPGQNAGQESPSLFISRIDKTTYEKVLNRMEELKLEELEEVLNEALSDWLRRQKK